MFWCEHSYIAYSTTYVGYSTLRRKSAFLCRKKISCYFPIPQLIFLQPPPFFPTPPTYFPTLPKMESGGLPQTQVGCNDPMHFLSPPDAFPPLSLPCSMCRACKGGRRLQCNSLHTLRCGTASCTAPPPDASPVLSLPCIVCECRIIMFVCHGGG